MIRSRSIMRLSGFAKGLRYMRPSGRTSFHRLGVLLMNRACLLCPIIRRCSSRSSPSRIWASSRNTFTKGLMLHRKGPPPSAYSPRGSKHRTAYSNFQLRSRPRKTNCLRHRFLILKIERSSLVLGGSTRTLRSRKSKLNKLLRSGSQSLKIN